MLYRIVYDTSNERHSAERLAVTVSATRLAKVITRLQDDGQIIYSVTRSN